MKPITIFFLLLALLTLRPVSAAPECQLSSGQSSGTVSVPFQARPGQVLQAVLLRLPYHGEANPGFPTVSLSISGKQTASGYSGLVYSIRRGGHALLTYKSVIAFYWSLSICPRT